MFGFLESWEVLGLILRLEIEKKRLRKGFVWNLRLKEGYRLKIPSLESRNQGGQFEGLKIPMSKTIRIRERLNFSTIEKEFVAVWGGFRERLELFFSKRFLVEF